MQRYLLFAECRLLRWQQWDVQSRWNGLLSATMENIGVSGTERLRSRGPKMAAPAPSFSVQPPAWSPVLTV